MSGDSDRSTQALALPASRARFHAEAIDWSSPVWPLEFVDQSRRLQGSLLELAGMGPIETPSRIVHQQPGLMLRAYGAKGNGGGDTILLVPAPIKRAYIWDLAPRVSVVRRCLEQGLQVYLAEWTPLPPEEDEAIAAEFGLEAYADRLLGACLDAIQSEGCGRTILAAHSLGGTFAAIHACLYPHRVRSLVLLATPLNFATPMDAFTPLVAAAPGVSALGRVFRTGRISGTFLDLAATLAAFNEFHVQRYADFLACSAYWPALDTHMRVERGLLDESALPSRLFADIVGELYCDNCLAKGSLQMGKRPVLPSNLRAPLLCVIDPHCHVAPPQSILPFLEAAASTSKAVLCYERDFGMAIQHVGPLVGNNAHARLWPAIFQWLDSVGGHWIPPALA